MRATTHRKWLKEKRRQEIARRRDDWSQEEFGLAVNAYRSGSRLTWVIDQEVFIALISLQRLRDRLLPQIEAQLVAQARAQGFSWDDIGFYLDVTRQAAQKRHPQADEDARLILSGGEVET